MKIQNSLNNTGVLFLEKPSHDLDRIYDDNLIETQDSEEKVKLLLVRDLLRLNWNIEKSKDKLVLSPPSYYNKEIIKQSMGISRREILNKNKEWIEKYIDLARRNLAQGKDVLKSKISPRIEICKTQEQHNLFRVFRYYWSSPYSEYVGRRIRFLIRDDGIDNSPIIGIAALGSSIIHIPDRDKWIGWNKETRTNNIIYIIDAYVLGALPPYNYLLGGKLISYILASNEIREIYKEKYKDKTTIIRKRQAEDLVCIFTTSLYGDSSQYNRLKFKNRLLYIPIGYTKGYGALHVSNETFRAMQQLLMEKGMMIMNRFGDGPNWRMRIIRLASDIIGFDSNIILQHSFRRGIYAVPLSKNFRSFLLGKADRPIYYNLPMQTLVKFWKERWLSMRKRNINVIDKILNFKPEDFGV
ncbi:MAG: DUF4338 domain-containing protein [Candidatus Aenigmarchaeota archaeon]|nr:DUF4338 domain-containing protein [Candidatus Aenigmarchaeota archaeon]